ncbi:hypothetical protein E2C01_046760 [Portunus trituberculatus]|uniref:Uncharacterized protein n=1 Tax=Portunus trituberculatus TaxID=210409 RepID=A0A5B7FZE1_PORTR|nr:hypothetical protein [Portunus trituberculatus]
MQLQTDEERCANAILHSFTLLHSPPDLLSPTPLPPSPFLAYTTGWLHLCLHPAHPHIFPSHALSLTPALADNLPSPPLPPPPRSPFRIHTRMFDSAAGRNKERWK